MNIRKLLNDVHDLFWDCFISSKIILYIRMEVESESGGR